MSRRHVPVGSLVMVMSSQPACASLVGRTATVVGVAHDASNAPVYVLKTKPTDASPLGLWRSIRRNFVPIVLANPQDGFDRFSPPNP